MAKLNAATGAPDTEDDAIDVALMFRRIWAGKWRILAFVFFAGLIGVATAFLRTPIYQADALLQLEEKKGALALPPGMSALMDNEPVSITELEIMRSRLVIGQAVASMHLDWSVRPRLVPVIGSAVVRFGIPLPDQGYLRRYVRSGESIRLDYLNVPPHWLDLKLTLTVGAEGAFTLELPDETVIEGRAGTRIADATRDFSIQVGEIVAGEGRKFDITQIGEIKAIDAVRSVFGAAERGRQSGVIQLAFSHEDPALAERILTEIANAYLQQNLERSAAEADSSLAFIQQQIPEAEAKLKAAEQALNLYMTEQQTVDLSLETEGVLSQVIALEGELRELDSREDELQQRYTSNHPVYQRLLGERARIEERLATLRSEVETLPETQQEMLNLTRTVQFEQEVYVQLLNRAQELQVVRASSIGSARIVDTARTAPRAIAPRKRNIVFVSLVLGLFSGVGYVLLRGWLQKGVQGAEDLEKLGVPVFATINLSKAEMPSRKTKGRLPVLADKNPTDLTVEGLRSLRTSLHFGMLDARTKTLSITSTAPGAGKSFTSVNLAVIAAQSGMKVCLIDADMRRGSLRRFFDVAKNAKGLAEFLAGQATLDEVLVTSHIPGLSFISTGRLPPNPSELLLRNDFKVLVETLDARFDLTLVDAPPVLAVNDPIIIGRTVGATIAVVRHRITPIGEVNAMLRLLETSNVKLAGMVLNGFDPRNVERETYSYRYDYRPQRD